MGKNKMSDFIIDSKDHCFFCLSKKSISQTNLEDNEFGTELPTVHSLQYLSRYLRMDMKKVFTEKGDTPPHLLAKVEMSRLKANLCERCAKLNETISKLCRSMEQIEMELLSSLQQIYVGLLEAEESNVQCQQLLVPVEDSEDEWIGKLGVLDVLRKEAIRKYSIKFQTTKPRIKLQSMSERGITKILEKYNLSSGRTRKKHIRNCTTYIVKSPIDLSGVKIEQSESLPDPSFEDPDVDYQSDFGTGSDSPATPINWQEQVVVKSENNESASSRESGSRRPKQGGILDPKINKHIERITSSGKMKYRCKLCRTGFGHSSHAARHIRTVHLKEKSHRCHQCSKAFSQKDNLKVHMLSHSGIKAYKCHLCPKAFGRKFNLKQHLVVHEEKRSHK